MTTSSSTDADATTDLLELPDEQDLELDSDSERDELAEVPTQPVALFELPPSKP